MSLEKTIFDDADLNAFADGRLEPSRAAALAESLAADRQARARMDAWKCQNDGLRTLFASVLFEPVPVRLMPTTLAVNGTSASPVRPARRSGGVMAMMILGIALVGFMAGALATVATGGFGRGSWAWRGLDTPRTGDGPSLIGRASETYEAMLADPGRPTAFPAPDKSRLQGWMMRHLSDAARIPDLRVLGWTLLDGRVVSGRQAPAAFLTYGSGADRLGLYVARTTVVERTAATDDGSIAVTTWNESGAGYALASSRDARRSARDLDALGAAVRRQMGDDIIDP